MNIFEGLLQELQGCFLKTALSYMSSPASGCHYQSNP